MNFSNLTDDILLKCLSEKDEVNILSLSVDEIEATFKSNVRLNEGEKDLELRIMVVFMDLSQVFKVTKVKIILKNPKALRAYIFGLLKSTSL